MSSGDTSITSGRNWRDKLTNKVAKIYYEIVGVMNFNSSIKEDYYIESSIRHSKINLRNSLKIIIIFWCGSMTFINPFGNIPFVFGLLCLIFLLFCYLSTMFIYTADGMQTLTIVMILILVINNMFNLYNSFGSPETNFTPTLQIGLLMFTNLQLRLHIAMILWLISYGLLLMTLIDIARYKVGLANVKTVIDHPSVYRLWKTPMFDKRANLERYVVGLVVLGGGITVLNMYLYFVNNLRRRAAFLRLGRNVQIKHQLKTAMKNQIRWIDAIMPKLIKNEYVEHNAEIKLDKWVYVKNFDNVTILFADIAGFTQICYNKSASEVVSLLNDIFNRFDTLCKLTNCEKLGTLGDCYYCVAGCPISRPDHAVSCIEMGLGMCRIIKQFNQDYGESVNMRVGVHTGRVNAAVIGKYRFRFDVYSNDVIIANTMESSGKPGFVHISQTVYLLVRLLYKVENGDDLEIKEETVQGIAGTILQSKYIKTYFIDPKSPHMQHGEQTIERRDNLKVLMHQKSSESRESRFSDSSKSETIEFKRSHSNLKSKILEDSEFIEDLKYDPERQIKFFIYPPINIFSLMFMDKEIEWNFNTVCANKMDKAPLESINLAPFFDSVSCLLYSSVIYVVLYITFPEITLKAKIIILLNICLSILLCIINLWQSYSYKHSVEISLDNILHAIITNPVAKSLTCFYFISTPLIVIICILNDCSKIYIDYTFTTRYFTLIIFSLFIIPLFTSANYLIKIFVCFLDVMGALVVVTWKPCGKINMTYTFDQRSCIGQLNITNITFYKMVEYNFIFQIFMTFILMILIIRELELNCRLLFYVTREVGIKMEQATEAVRNAEQLLYNIIPKYVFNQLLTKSEELPQLNDLSYATTIPKAAVVFAGISNFFSNYYREDYKGGENALKLLHKIICCFDDIINNERYKDVEKIKTINDCYVVASGLNFKMLDKNMKNAHLYALMHYAFDMVRVLDYFNDNFIIGADKFQLKIGYNFGTVIAGIIGSTKPMYDIWGDTVNMASKMYTTGTPGLIQVPEHVISELSTEFLFEHHGQIVVKGKGNIDTYICISSISEEEKAKNLLDKTDQSFRDSQMSKGVKNLKGKAKNESRSKTQPKSVNLQKDINQYKVFLKTPHRSYLI